ncbi:Co-chaperone [Lithohypha guttulata]|uniref:Co-chaperone n=1 Tax=Lithohypha guttulata TaxID=1690604 RepID=A0AAN7YGY4_9EURO|nr:Co-chaperone [Lithohypha guttulata]KAK5086506.1 Co-chaperone [Lithohypha guttulata]
MVLHNPNNWHWVNKDVGPWAKDYLDSQVREVSAEEDGVSAKVTKLTSMDGDVDVSQRKGKIITIFDVSLRLDYEGKTKDGVDVAGSIKVPECAYDTEPDEYVFDIDIYSETKEKQPVKDLVKSKIVPQLREVFQKLAPALVAEHGKDIQHATSSNPSSGFATPTWHPQKERVPVNSTSTTKTSAAGNALVNTTTVTANDEFRTTAEELFKTFTDPQRIAAFTRAAPKKFEGAEVGAKFEIFDGNVLGEYVKLDSPKQIVQKWRLAQWPAGHHSLQDISFDQNDVDQVTNMRVTWTGVPVGQEDVVQRNWEGYYVRSIKQTFGFGTIL